MDYPLDYGFISLGFYVLVIMWYVDYILISYVSYMQWESRMDFIWLYYYYYLIGFIGILFGCSGCFMWIWVSFMAGYIEQAVYNNSGMPIWFPWEVSVVVFCLSVPGFQIFLPLAWAWLSVWSFTCISVSELISSGFWPPKNMPVSGLAMQKRCESVYCIVLNEQSWP